MEKFLTFLKRTCSLIGVLVLLFCCSAPVFAADTGTSWRLPIPFTEIHFLHGGEQVTTSAILPFPITSDGAYSVTDGSYGLDVRSSSVSSNVSATYDIVSASAVSGIRLVAHEFVWPLSDMEALEEVFQFLFYNTGSVITGELHVQVTTNGLYRRYSDSQGEFFPDTHTYSHVKTSSWNLMDWFSWELSSDPDFIFVEELVVTFTFSQSVDSFNIWYPTDTPTADFVQWANGEDLSYERISVNPSDPSGVNLVDWLSVAVGGFLDFELWPGMSLNQLLWVCLVIGILFTFFKMVV